MEMAVKAKTLMILNAAIFTLWFTFDSANMGIFSSFQIGKRSWQDVATSKRAEIHSKIPKDWLLPSKTLERARKERKIVGDFIESLLDTEILTITSLDSVEMVERMSSGSTAVQTAMAFCKRAAFAHQLVEKSPSQVRSDIHADKSQNNNLLEIAFESALERAAELDDYFKKHWKIIGTSHSLPFTF